MPALPRLSLCASALLVLAAPALLPGQNVATFHTRNVPAACEATMKSLVAAGHQIRFVAFPPAGGDRRCGVRSLVNTGFHATNYRLDPRAPGGHY